MGTEPNVRIEEHGNARVVSFFVHCQGPEKTAWDMLREWVRANITDFTARRYIGCAPKGHHPEGEAHDANEGEGSHEYVAQMLLFGDEGKSESFLGADVTDAPGGLYLVGDVALNEYNDRGEVDIGTSMQTAYGVMAERLQGMGGYAFALGERPYFEEHIFHPGWFTGELPGDGALAGFKLWLPIKKG